MTRTYCDRCKREIDIDVMLGIKKFDTIKRVPLYIMGTQYEFCENCAKMFERLYRNFMDRVTE